jgi:hypothetical protein
MGKNFDIRGISGIGFGTLLINTGPGGTKLVPSIY